METTLKCPFCGRLYKGYSMYAGDQSCCPKCREAAERNDYPDRSFPHSTTDFIWKSECMRKEQKRKNDEKLESNIRRIRKMMAEKPFLPRMA